VAASPFHLAAPALGLALLGCLGSGCAATGSMATVPRPWRKTNPWGPEALQARARGELQPLFYTRQMACWAAFARHNLRDGDILFRHARNTSLRTCFSNHVLTTGCSSSFTHNGIAFHEGGTVWVYDVEPDPQGVRKIPFEFWMLDTQPGSLAVKRVRAPFRHCIPQAHAYLEEVWLRQPPFDMGLRLDDERLYCSEMIEKAYRSAGLPLSDPIPIRCLPGYNRYRLLRPVAEAFTEIRVDEPIFALGNVWYGTYGSPYLELVYGGETRHSVKPPLCPPVPFPAGGPCPPPPALSNLPPVAFPGGAAR
jgi:hypothetical protein